MQWVGQNRDMAHTKTIKEYFTQIRLGLRVMTVPEYSGLNVPMF